VVDLLAEADPGVQPDALLGDPASDGMLEPLGEERLDVVDDVAVARIALHRARLAEHVHEAHVAARAGDRAGHCRVAAERRDVVDDRRAGLQRRRGHSGLGGVDREPRRAAGEPLEDRHDAPQLLGLADRLGAGAGGLAADVENVGSLGRQPPAVGDGGLRIRPRAAIGERVGRDVHDAHDDRVANVGLHCRGHGSQASGRPREYVLCQLRRR
jgi:hypothetical protein